MKVASARPLVVTGGALLVLAAVSFALSYVGLGAASLPVALAIAVSKALLVLAVFMELKDEPASAKWAIFTAILLISILVLFAVLDVATRTPPPLAVPPSGP